MFTSEYDSCIDADENPTPILHGKPLSYYVSAATLQDREILNTIEEDFGSHLEFVEGGDRDFQYLLIAAICQRLSTSEATPFQIQTSCGSIAPETLSNALTNYLDAQPEGGDASLLLNRLDRLTPQTLFTFLAFLLGKLKVKS